MNRGNDFKMVFISVKRHGGDRIVRECRNFCIIRLICDRLRAIQRRPCGTGKAENRKSGSHLGPIKKADFLRPLTLKQPLFQARGPLRGPQNRLLEHIGRGPYLDTFLCPGETCINELSCQDTTGHPRQHQQHVIELRALALVHGHGERGDMGRQEGH